MFEENFEIKTTLFTHIKQANRIPLKNIFQPNWIKWFNSFVLWWYGWKNEKSTNQLLTCPTQMKKMLRIL